MTWLYPFNYIIYVLCVVLSEKQTCIHAVNTYYAALSDTEVVFTDLEWSLFERRQEEGYDMPPTGRYKLWLEMYHPEGKDPSCCTHLHVHYICIVCGIVRKADISTCTCKRCREAISHKI